MDEEMIAQSTMGSNGITCMALCVISPQFVSNTIDTELHESTFFFDLQIRMTVLHSFKL